MNSNALTRAWNWSVERSPLLNTYRYLVGRQYAKTKARDLIHAADLPSELSTLIDTTVTKTKLWRSERADIARELIAHTQDALDASRSPEQIIKTFGHPKKVAKLFRRATKRKRPLYWRTLRNLRRATATLALLVIVAYGSLAARFYIGKPNIKINYATLINSHNDAYTENQKAWPVYKEIDIQWKNHINQLLLEKQAHDQELGIHTASHPQLDPFDQITPDHPDYDKVVQLVRSFEPQLKRLRQATHRPIIGIELGFKYEQIENQEWSNSTPLVPPNGNPEENPSLINMLLPHLGIMRQFANILSFETLIAARESNSDRTYDNLSAMLAIARQESFGKFLISSHVDMAIANMAFKSIHQVLHEHPGVLTRDHLVALSHELAITRPALDLQLDGEIMMFEDLIQRAYTDNGHGNGRITQNGALMLANYANNTGWGDTELEGTPLQMATGPITLAVSPDRKSQATIYMNMMDTVRYVASTGPENYPLVDYQAIKMHSDTKNIPGLVYSPIDIFMPAMGQSINSMYTARMTNDAATAMLAIEIYKIDHGHHPESLTALTPNYLPSLPQDLFDPGKPLKYKVTNTGYLLYSVASDADDDNATTVEFSEHTRYNRPAFGDRFPYTHTEINGKLFINLDPSGNPIHTAPTGPDGDWILFDMTPHPPK